MRPFLFLLLFTGYLSAQDSLFWFDMNSVRDPVPKTPKILDKIFGTSQFGLLDSLKNIRITTQEGYRLQIFESSSVEETNRTLRKFERSLKDSVYMVFEAPLYKLRLGNFVTKKEAEKQKENLNKKGYKNIWIVRSRIEQSSKIQNKL